MKTKDNSNSGLGNIEIIDPSDVGKLDQNSFLQMLLTQLQNQDPMSPMDSNDFAVQMAQFSQVEQLTSINKKLDILGELILMGVLPEKPEGEGTEKPDNEGTEKPDGNNGTEDKEPPTEKPEDPKQSIINKELENLNSITFKADFDYDNKATEKLQSKFNNLILRSKYI